MIARARPVQIALLVLSLLGTGISGYLVYAHYFKIDPVCLPGAPCEVVLTTRYADMWGVPLSLLGMLMYLGLVVLNVWQLVKGEKAGLAAAGVYSLALAGTLFSLYLLYLEAFVIHGYCTWCLASGVVILVTFILSIVNLFQMGLTFRGLPRYIRLKMGRLIGW
jgi:uncharacterized membrane protein